MARDVQVLEVFREEAEPVGGGVHIGVVNLVRIAREHDLGAFARAGEDGLDLVGREVLGFVHDEVLLGDGAAADVGEGLDAQVARLFELSGRHGGAAAQLHVGGDDEFEVVVDGLHVGPQLLVHIAGQVAEVAAHGHDGSAHEQFVVALVIHDLLQARGDGEQRLARAGLAQQGDDLDGFIHEQFQRELLFAVARLDAPGRRFVLVERAQAAFGSVHARQRGVAGVGVVGESDELVGLQAQRGVGLEPLVVERIHGFRVHFPGAVAGVEFLHLHHVRGVVLGLKAHGVGLDSEVAVL